MTRGVTLKLDKNKAYCIVFQGKVLATLDHETTTEILDNLKDLK